MKTLIPLILSASLLIGCSSIPEKELIDVSCGCGIEDCIMYQVEFQGEQYYTCTCYTPLDKGVNI